MTQEKSTGTNLDEKSTQSPIEEGSDSAAKILVEEKTKLEDQLKELSVRLLEFLCLYTPFRLFNGKLYRPKKLGLDCASVRNEYKRMYCAN